MQRMILNYSIQASSIKKETLYRNYSNTRGGISSGGTSYYCYDLLTKASLNQGWIKCYDKTHDYILNIICICNCLFQESYNTYYILNYFSLIKCDLKSSRKHLLFFSTSLLGSDRNSTHTFIFNIFIVVGHGRKMISFRMM